MRADFKVFLDACVLANFGVCDLLLRPAEKPRQYLPVWSDAVLDEVYRAHTEKLGWPEELAVSFGRELRRHFPKALASSYDHLLPAVTNDPKDRHVLAAPSTPGRRCSSRSTSRTSPLKRWTPGGSAPCIRKRIC